MTTKSDPQMAMGTGEKRRSGRSHVLLSATIEKDEVILPVKLRNLSEVGALVCGEQLPEVGNTVTFSRKSLSVECRVAWVHARHAGLAFTRQLDRREVLEHIPVSVRRAVASVDFKRPGFSCRPLTAEEQRLVEQWGYAGPQ